MHREVAMYLTCDHLSRFHVELAHTIFWPMVLPVRSQPVAAKQL